jgi:hypothetical protein
VILACWRYRPVCGATRTAAAARRRRRDESPLALTDVVTAAGIVGHSTVFLHGGRLGTQGLVGMAVPGIDVFL